jgi:hypothetical protein
VDTAYYEIGPGFAGFVATFAIAIALVLLYKVRRDAMAQEEARRAASAEGASAPVKPASSGRVEDGDSGGDVVAHEADDS